MKILHVITTLRTGGAERLMVDLLPRFKEKGYDVDLCILNGKRTPFYEELSSKGIKIFDFGEDNSVYSFKNISRLRKLMKNYDIIHTHNSSPQFFVAMANKGLGKILVTTEHNTHNRRRHWPGFSLIDRWMYGCYKSIICISDQAEENLRNFLKSESSAIKTIYNGVDLSRFIEATPSNDISKASPEIRNIIMVAAFRPQKDQKTLIQSMTSLPERFQLYLVGEGECLAECKSLTASLCLNKRIHFLGRRNDVGELLKASDYVVMSSHYEGLSLSSIEGMCVSKPFLASDVDGLREVVKGHGIIFPHQDSKALAEEILKLDSNQSLYKEVADKCFARANDFDICKMVENYLNVYTQLSI